MSYEGKHRDDSPEAERLGLDRDHLARWDAIYPCRHHHPRHSTYVCKVREVAS